MQSEDTGAPDRNRLENIPRGATHGQRSPSKGDHQVYRPMGTFLRKPGVRMPEGFPDGEEGRGVQARQLPAIPNDPPRRPGGRGAGTRGSAGDTNPLILAEGV